MTKVRLHINDKLVEADVAPELSTASFLHEHLGLMATRVCCAIGICKACTFACCDAPGGEPRNLLACLTPIAKLDNKHIATAEGLATGGHLTALQDAFLKHFAFQCGFCTSGFLMAATVLVEQLKSKPAELAQLDRLIDEAIGDNICRCTGYVKYHAAVRDVITSSPGLVRR